MDNFDILKPEFFEMAEKAKHLYDEKERKIAEFKETYLNHKKEITDLESQAAQLKSDYLNAKNSQEK